MDKQTLLYTIVFSIFFALGYFTCLLACWINDELPTRREIKRRMKNRLFLFVCMAASSSAFSQRDIKTGSWQIGETLISRPVDSLQIEYCQNRTDTFRIEWKGFYDYTISKPGRPTLTVKVWRISKRGYSGKICDGTREKWFEAIDAPTPAADYTTEKRNRRKGH